ncbi:MAG: hypothetical protein HN377_06880 [Alphaproteobacteria bacterium]|jgi:hypothetical protein|nr:hypothetical protein [Alphaproteobacteria bacterium]
MSAVQNAPTTGSDGAGEGIPFCPSALDPERIEIRLEKSLLGKVRKLVDDFPDRALEVIRAWVAEGV